MKMNRQKIKNQNKITTKKINKIKLKINKISKNKFRNYKKKFKRNKQINQSMRKIKMRKRLKF